MEKIQMVDLYSQYLNIKSEVDNSIQEVIESSAFINGPQVKEFRNELKNYLGCKHVAACGNGTDALQIALMALNLSPGDEVIVPDFTFIATAEVIALLKLKPVFVDIDPDTFLMDLSEVEKKITLKTKAIIPVHLYGQCVDMDALMALSEKYNLSVIEDNAQAIGADVAFHGSWRKAGTIGHIGCTSFFPSKNLGCFGDGGAIFTNSDSLADEISSIANHGSKIKYYNDIVGVNSRLDTIQAAILKVKLKKLDEYIACRQRAASYYDTLLSNVPEVQVPKRVNYSTHVFHQYTLKAENRDELRMFLQEKKIPSMIYYPLGMHNQKAYKTDEKLEVSDKLCTSVLSIPMHTELTTEQQEYIGSTIKSFYAH
jgi:UDP-2-acetamido-2-deoxy-ribo-hexuluronate aminotransferase